MLICETINSDNEQNIKRKTIWYTITHQLMTTELHTFGFKNAQIEFWRVEHVDYCHHSFYPVA